mmetsp:Transcript_125829/g.199432  ORF Transcript_125829/g.199432 Transcript_125829/m.199432 type:complete len:126 (+) Transcript_125829:2-379(+)
MPTWDQLLFNIITYVSFPLLVFSAAGVGPLSVETLGLLGNPYVVALLMSLGPAIVGIMLLGVTAPRPFARPALTFLYPFHKEKWLGTFGGNVLMSLCLTVLPVYQMIYMFVSEPGQGVYFFLWGK